MTHSFPTRLSSDLVAEADPAGEHRQQGADVLRRQQSPVGKALGVDGEGGGQQLDAAGPVQPAPGDEDTDLQQMFGSVWEWTGSAYRPYPGFRAAPGASQSPPST